MNEKLFLQYAFPCARVLLKRGSITRQDYGMLEAALGGGRLAKPLEEIFPVATTMLRVMTGKALSDVTDDEIRDYFWRGHDQVVEERAKEFCDIDPEECKLKRAKVIKTGSELVLDGGRKVRKLFRGPVRVGDIVAVHYDCACEVVE